MLVVVVAEAVELVLKLSGCLSARSGGEPPFQGLVEPFDLPLGLRVVRCAVLLDRTTRIERTVELPTKCARCGNKLKDVKPTGRPRIDCSPACRKAAYEDRRAHRDGAVKVQVVERVVTDVRERRVDVPRSTTQANRGSRGFTNTPRVCTTRSNTVWTTISRRTARPVCVFPVAGQWPRIRWEGVDGGPAECRRERASRHPRRA